MMDSKHTSLPWRVGMHNDCVVFDAAGECISDTYGSGYPKDVERANAAFIVRAVNSNAQLVMALEHARDHLYDAAHPDHQVGVYYDICAALAAAGA